MSNSIYSDQPCPVIYLFPGQGSQHVGMGRDLADRYPVAAQTLREADEILGFALSELCFNGPEDLLTDTVNAQPALLATSIAAFRVLAEAVTPLPRPLFFAGHSMGEYSALVAANSLTFADGLRLVRERGRLMAQAGVETPGKMAAVLALDEETVARCCQEASVDSGGVVQIANDNCPGQIVISGDETGLDRAVPLLEEAGARKVVVLQVSIAAHSPLMQPAAQALQQAIDTTSFTPPVAPVIGNTTAQPLTSIGDLTAELAAQLTGSVRWTGSMQHALHAGVQTFVEIGPGDVLSGLMKRIDRKSERISVSDPVGVEAFVARFG